MLGSESEPAQQFRGGAGASEGILHADFLDNAGDLGADGVADCAAQAADDAVFLHSKDLAGFGCGLADQLLVQGLDGVDIDNPGADAFPG